MLKQLRNINIFFFVSFQCPAGLSRIVRIDPCVGTPNIACQSKSMRVCFYAVLLSRSQSRTVAAMSTQEKPAQIGHVWPDKRKQFRVNCCVDRLSITFQPVKGSIRIGKIVRILGHRPRYDRANGDASQALRLYGNSRWIKACGIGYWSGAEARRTDQEGKQEG